MAIVSVGLDNGKDSRLGTLLARLPELKRANIEHRLIAAQVHQMTPDIEISNLWQEVYLGGDGIT